MFRQKGCGRRNSSSRRNGDSSSSSISSNNNFTRKKGGSFSTGVLSLHEGVILLQVEEVLSLRSGFISLRRIMTRVIPLRRKMTRHFVGGGGGIFLRYTGDRLGHCRPSDGLRPTLYTSPDHFYFFSVVSYLAGLLSMHFRRSAAFRLMACISWCTQRLIVDLSQIIRRLFHDISLSSRQLIPTYTVFSAETIGRATATRRPISSISTFDHQLFNHTHAD